MSNDDSRGLESPDRSHVSTSETGVYTDSGTTDGSIRERLESISELTRGLLEDVQQADHAQLETVDEETCRETRRRLREIDAEAMRVGCELFGPEFTISTDTDDNVPTIVSCGSLTTTYSGPTPGAFEHVQQVRESASKTDGPDQSTTDYQPHGDRDAE